MNAKDMNLKIDEWADLIDETKKRVAIGDMSTIAYRMLNVIVTLRHNTSQPVVEAEAQKECRCYKFYKQQNSYNFCPDCGRDLRTA